MWISEQASSSLDLRSDSGLQIEFSTYNRFYPQDQVICEFCCPVCSVASAISVRGPVLYLDLFLIDIL